MNPSSSQSLPPGTLAALVLIPLALVLLSGWAAIQTDRQARESQAMLLEMHEEWRELTTMMRTLVEAQTGQRGFLITGDRAFLAPYEQAQSRIAASLEWLRSAPGSAKRLREIEPLVVASVAVMRDNVARAERGERQSAIAEVTAGEGQRRMDAVRAAIGAWADETARAVVVQRAELEKALQLSRGATQAAIVMQVLLCGVAAFALWRWSKLRSLVVICAWSRTINHRGEWVSFEEYLWREFGIRSSHGMSPGEVEKFAAELRGRADRARQT